MISVVEKSTLHKPGPMSAMGKKQVLPSPQLFKPSLDLEPAGVADVAMLTIRAVDSQEGEQVAGPASQVHNHLIHMFRRRDT
jgi:hypothetical protein